MMTEGRMVAKELKILKEKKRKKENERLSRIQWKKLK
jgi:hypothetical protein